MSSSSPGELAIVLHTHMPYVEGGGPWPPKRIQDYMDEHGCDFDNALHNTTNPPNPEGFGTWPFGEEWLWEAAATSYLPLLDVLDELGPARTRSQLTLSLTPVLCDQLAVPAAMQRCVEFLQTVRPASHQLDIDAFEASGDHAAVKELRRSAAEYNRAADRLSELEQGRAAGLMHALGRHATWTSSATHAILPLLVLDEGIELQVNTGIEAFRNRFGDWFGGFWLPECAHTPRLGHHLTEAGVRSTCVELTELFGLGDARNLRAVQPDEGPVMWPIDRAIIDLAWGEHGYPSRAAYRSYHHRTTRDHHVWANDGSVYDHERALTQARADAAEFVAAAIERLADGGVCVFAIDTELLGHWWYEGPSWLCAVIGEAQRQGLPLTTLDDHAAERHPPAQLNLPEQLMTTSWGEGRDVRTWSGPPVAELAWQARNAELRTFLAGRKPTPRALRELMALQSSDWAFLDYRRWSGDYARQRALGHLAALDASLTQGKADESDELRGLAPWLPHS